MAQRKTVKKTPAEQAPPKEQRKQGGVFMPLFGQMSVILDSLLTPVVILDRNFSVLFANQAALSLAPISEQNFFSVIPGIEDIVKEFTAKNIETEILNDITVKFDYGVCHMRMRISWVGGDYLLLSFEDVSREVSLMSQLRQAQKMESIGQLTSGIAHDFNNILTVIGGYADIIRKKLTDEQLKKYLDQIYISTEKGTSLIRGLLTFSRQNETDYIICNLHQLINSAINMFDRMLKEHIRLVIVPFKRDLYVMADSIQLEQVIMNLFTNAQDAMPDGGTITITLSVENALDIDVTSIYAKEYAVIKVEDCGQGMEPHIVKQIFNPFFTTKPPQKGTGLGLAMVNEIVKNHKGKITCSSVVNEGTVFYIYLPLLNIVEDPPKT